MRKLFLGTFKKNKNILAKTSIFTPLNLEKEDEENIPYRYFMERSIPVRARQNALSDL
jgi:hypothetical protein